MTIIQAIVLGMVQGFSEFLPISSSGHLVLVPALLGWGVQAQAFDIVVHMGTLVAVIVYFRKKIFSIFRACINFRTPSPEKKLGLAILLAMIPAGLVGLFFSEYIDSVFRTPRAVAYSLMIGAVILFYADWYSRRKVASHQDISRIRFFDSMIIGCAQVAALIPGISRSGITISAGLFQKFSKTDAVEFSFLMSIPVIALAGLSAFRDILTKGSAIGITVPIFGVGFAVAAISGFFSIWLTFFIVRKLNFSIFVAYRILLGIAILIFVV